MSIFNFTKRPKLEYLKWWDILIVTIIMFSSFIMNSFSTFSNLDNTNVAELPEFTSSANWHMISFQGSLLILAFIYLYIRNFDFSKWKIKITPKAIFWGVLIFCFVGLIFDLYFTVIYEILPLPKTDNSIFYESEEQIKFFIRLMGVDLSLILYSVLNGFYEEIFFLGVCLSVPKEQKIYYFIYSLIIRYAFHTYQGNISAIGIGLIVGIAYYVLYERMEEKNLFPFFLAHAIADVFGTSFISFFY